MATILEELVDPGKNEVSNKQVSILLDGRRYGDEAPLKELFGQPIPPAFIPIAEEIAGQSQLLKLHGDTSKKEIFNAYAVDLELLNRYMQEFEGAVEQAVRCSIITWNQDDLSTAEQWKGLKDQIPPLGSAVLLALSATRAAKAVPELLRELKQEFDQSVIYVIRRMAIWLELLVDEEVVGLNEWAGEDACAYHYFLHEEQEKVLEQEKRTEVIYDPDKPRGQRYTDTRINKRTVQRSQSRERHVHHIVNTHVWELPDFPDKLPKRVCVFLDAMPEWLQPHVRIVSGDITMVEQLRKVTSDNVAIEEEVLSVWKRSPALVLGPFVLLGWSADDLKLGAGFARLQKAVDQTPLPKKVTLGMVLGILSALVISVMAVPFVGIVGAASFAVVIALIVLVVFLWVVPTHNNKAPSGDMIKVDPKE